LIHTLQANPEEEFGQLNMAMLNYAFHPATLSIVALLVILLVLHEAFSGDDPEEDD
jgi:hypothetical protein